MKNKHTKANPLKLNPLVRDLAKCYRNASPESKRFVQGELKKLRISLGENK